MLRTTNPREIDFKEKFSLKNKVIIITGACGLVGRAFCEAAAQFGANVVVADIEESEPQKHATLLEGLHKNKMLGIPLLVENKSSVSNMLEKVLEVFGKVDGLVNAHQNKSHLIFEPFEDVLEENWDKIMEVNLKGTFLTCQVVGSWMAKNNGGAIINMPSTYSVVAPNQNLYKGTNLGCPSAYSASKGGIDALSRYLATYWAEKQIRVNMITPHGVWNHHEEQFEKNFANFTPLKRLSYNHEVASALVYLLSDASSYMTGHNMVIDGGWTTW